MFGRKALHSVSPNVVCSRIRPAPKYRMIQLKTSLHGVCGTSCMGMYSDHVRQNNHGEVALLSVIMINRTVGIHREECDPNGMVKWQSAKRRISYLQKDGTSETPPMQRLAGTQKSSTNRIFGGINVPSYAQRGCFTKPNHEQTGDVRLQVNRPLSRGRPVLT